jgi:copper oxidase (laccase) domain-containing protein
MESLGAKRSDIHAVVGPCINQDNYEVGPEFMEQFLAQSKDHARFFAEGRDDRQHFDLKAYVRARLISFGVGQAEALPDCTYAAPDRYFSYRYNSHNGLGDYGRNISAIAITA